MNTGWLAVTTDENDPTKITARRMSQEDVTEFYKQQYADWLMRCFPNTLLSVTELVDKLVQIPIPPDEKAEARTRSKNDLNRKRKELMKRRGK